MSGTRPIPDAADAAAAQRIAERSRDAMLVGDHATKALGIDIVDVGPGRATATMTVRQDMVNGHAIGHGGLITTLADSAFAFACNAYNEVTVAAGFTVDLVAPARLGDVLTARCREVSRSSRSGVYDVEVTNQHGARVALFRGRSHTFRGRTLFDDGSTPAPAPSAASPSQD